MSTRPRPRPKPRARVASSAPPSSPGGPASRVATPLTKVVEIEDEDALFIRNKTTADQAWKSVERYSAERDRSSSPVEINSDSDHDSPSNPPRRKRRFKKSDSKDAMPAWTKSANAIVCASISSSDDDDDDIILGRIESSEPGTKRASRGLERRDRKRQRSRSRSITPPPAVPAATMQFALDTVRQTETLSAVRRMLDIEKPSEPTIVLDESDDEVTLDPELARIAAQVKSDVLRQQSEGPAFSRGTTPALEGGPEQVAIKVRWKPHPLNETAKSELWEFRMKRHDSFRQLFEEVADLAAVLSEHVIVTYNDKRVFPSASPHGIGVWEEAELEACEKRTYDYIRSHRRRSPSVTNFPNDSPSKARGLSPTLEEPEEPDDGPEEEDDKFKLTLRSAATKDITLTVRPTTKCKAIIQAFLKQAGLADKYPTAPAKPAGRRGKASAPSLPQLMVDGDKLDPESEISVADLEDGDLVEVVGL
ncbi:hypothetical protein K474DRAFT_1756869 [Panus rudis PR-1116 ss-1]|nr:hypothetical protein K474DRAFT_1756869 [Panus rudis PR-1116 ss-1]